MTSITLDGRCIGPGEPTYIVAAMSANHGGDLSEAMQILGAAKRAGADGVRLHTFTPETVTLDAGGEKHVAGTGSPWAGRPLYEILDEARMPWEWQSELQELAHDLEIDLFSTPGDADAVEFLEGLGVPAYKLSSYELGDLVLIRTVAATGKPILLSTGMATHDEIGEAVDAARQGGCRDLALLHCLSAYPAPAEAANLRAIPELSSTFGVPVGLSDHTLGAAVPVAAVALGAAVIEKHLCLSRARPGVDSFYALEPDELSAMVAAVRDAERALTTAGGDAPDDEAQSRALRRSLWIVEDIAAGEALSEHHVRSLRPAHGLAPRHLQEVLGRPAARALSRGTPLIWSDLAGD